MSSPEPESEPAPAGSLRDQKRWPMWPFALAIILFVPLYTYLNLEYRKEGKAYEPFQAMMDRMNAIVEKNMYDWYGIKTSRAPSAAPLDAAPATVRAEDGLLDEIVPEQLKYYMPTRPILVPGAVQAEGPRRFSAGEPLRVRIHVPADIADDERLNLLAFYKEGDLYLLASLFVDERAEISADFSGAPQAVDFLIPSDPIGAETVQVHFLSEGRLIRWQMTNLAPFEEETSPAEQE